MSPTIGKKMTVRAAPGRATPLPPSIRRSPTGATCIVCETPKDRSPHPHELVGDVELELVDAVGVEFVRRRIARGDLIDVNAKSSPARAAAAARKE